MVRLDSPSKLNSERSRRNKDFTGEDTWRVFRIMAEFVEGFETLSGLGPAVAIFGSARTKKGNRFYQKAERLAHLLVKEGYAVVTGAGPGIMEAANKGAAESGGKSVGLNIELPMEQTPNPYANILLSFHYFFCRKVMFVKYAKAFFIFPGGFGTLDEFFESTGLIQTQRIHPFPVILIGKKYWQGLLAWFKKSLVANHYISKKDMKIFHIVEEPDEAIDVLRKYYQ